MELDIPITIAGMSFGALSGRAKEALGRGASMAGTSTTTGDGGMTPEERGQSKNLIYQLLPSRYGMNPNDLRKAAKRLKEIGVKPEIEAFDLGNMWFGAQLYKEGLLSDPPMFQMCLGIPWGAPATTLAMQAMKDIMPKEGVWSGFAISKNEMPFVAQTVLLGGNPRVGLEDNLYLSKGKLATNAQLVEKAIRIVDELGYSTMTPAETREKLKLTKHK